MIQEHKDFLIEHYNNWETIQSGYMRNVDMTILRMYEHIYKTYLDKNFVLTHWCSECKMDMVKRIYKLYDSLPIAEPKMEYKGIEVTIVTKEHLIELTNDNFEQESIFESIPKKRGRKPNKK